MGKTGVIITGLIVWLIGINGIFIGELTRERKIASWIVIGTGIIIMMIGILKKKEGKKEN